MGKPQLPGVEHLARRIQGRRRKVFAAVNRVAQDRMAGAGEMNANLMRAARLELHGHERGSSEPFEGAVTRHRPAAFLAGLGDAAASVPRVANEISIEGAVPVDVSFDESDVLPFDVMKPKETLQELKGLAIAGEDESAGGVAVQPMHDEGGRPAPVSVMQVVEDSRQQRVLLVIGRRDREQARRLLDDQEVGVFDEHG